MYQGCITSIKLDRGFGFISSPGQPDAFFHHQELRGDLEFDEQLMERRVQFDLLMTSKGPRANNVRPAD